MNAMSALSTGFAAAPRFEEGGIVSRCNVKGELGSPRVAPASSLAMVKRCAA